MIGVIVPAHNEEDHIEACLRSLGRAANHAGVAGEQVEIIVVLDACDDGTASVARALGARTLSIAARNVGIARRAGSAMALDAGARWLAFTDADSVVAPGWLAAQLSLKADAVCGTVAVEDWGRYGERMRRHFEHTYTDEDGHSHVHGANLGVSAQAYTAAGGFTGLETGEDVAFVEALKRSGARIAWSRMPRVVTSVRSGFKAPRGFGATLKKIDALRLWAGVETAVAA